MNRMKLARVSGASFLFYVVAGATNEFLMGRATDANGTTAILVHLAAHSNEVRIATLLSLAESLSAFVLAVSLYGLTRDQDADLARFGLLCRGVEGLLGALGIQTKLGLLWLAGASATSPPPAAAISAVLGPLYLSSGGPLGAIFFALGNGVFAYLMGRGRMIPRALAILGVLSSVLLAVALPLHLAGFANGTWINFLWLPAFIYAPLVGGWLLVRGVRP